MWHLKKTRIWPFSCHHTTSLFSDCCRTSAHGLWTNGWEWISNCLLCRCQHPGKGTALQHSLSTCTVVLFNSYLITYIYFSPPSEEYISQHNAGWQFHCSSLSHYNIHTRYPFEFQIAESSLTHVLVDMIGKTEDHAHVDYLYRVAHFCKFIWQ